MIVSAGTMDNNPPLHWMAWWMIPMGNWDVCHHKRGMRSFMLDHLMSLSSINIGLTDHNVNGWPPLLGIDLGHLGVAFNCLMDAGLAEVLQHAHSPTTLDLEGNAKRFEATSDAMELMWEEDIRLRHLNVSEFFSPGAAMPTC